MYVMVNSIRSFKTKVSKHIVLGYPTSVVKGVGDEFISVKESLIS